MSSRDGGRLRSIRGEVSRLSTLVQDLCRGDILKGVPRQRCRHLVTRCSNRRAIYRTHVTRLGGRLSGTRAAGISLGHFIGLVQGCGSYSALASRVLCRLMRGIMVRSTSNKQAVCHRRRVSVCFGFVNSAFPDRVRVDHNSGGGLARRRLTGHGGCRGATKRGHGGGHTTLHRTTGASSRTTTRCRTLLRGNHRQYHGCTRGGGLTRRRPTSAIPVRLRPSFRAPRRVGKRST